MPYKSNLTSGVLLTKSFKKLILSSIFPDFKTPLWTPWLRAKKTSTLHDLLKLFNISNDLSDGLGIKKLLSVSKKFNTSGLVVRKDASTYSILSKIRSLFLSKSGPFLFKGSRNHWPNLVLG